VIAWMRSQYNSGAPELFCEPCEVFASHLAKLKNARMVFFNGLLTSHNRLLQPDVGRA
jgi:hypothetical protein